MKPATRYLDTLFRSLRARERGEEILEDELLQSLDRLWLEMNELEIEYVNYIVKKFVKGDVPLTVLEAKLKKKKKEEHLKLIKNKKGEYHPKLVEANQKMNPDFNIALATKAKKRFELFRQEVRIKGIIHHALDV